MPKAAKKPDMAFQLYADVRKEDGGFEVPEPLGEIMAHVEDMIARDFLDEEYVAVFDTITTLLATPAALQAEVAKEMLLDIIEVYTVDDSDYVDIDDNIDKEETTVTNASNIGFKKPDNTNTSTTLLAGEVENLTVIDDISDEELLAEYKEKPENLIEE